MSKKQNWYTNPRKYHFIYKTTCSVNGKYYYGMHSTDDLEDGYIGSGTYLWHSIKKHGRENFKLEILEHCANREALKLREVELITEEMLKDPLCMNLKYGGEGGWNLSDEQFNTRNKKCNSLLVEKIKTNPELRKKFSDQMAEKNKIHTKRWNAESNKTRCIGRIASQETKEKLSVSQSGEKNSQYGSAWIFNILLKVSKKVRQEEVEHYLMNGWKCGRKMKF